MIYLASPYTRDQDNYYYLICSVLNYLRKRSADVFYSPIAQWHHIAKNFSIKGDYETFKEMDRRAIQDCVFGYCALPGHRESVGMADELKWAELKNREIRLYIPTFSSNFSMAEIDSYRVNNVPIITYVKVIEEPCSADFIALP